MRRIWIEPESITRPTITLSGEAFHHAIQVTKFQVGEEFEVVFGGAQALRVRVREVSKKTAFLDIVGERKLPVLPLPQVNLAVCLPRWATFESVIEKCVEMGVHTLQPLVSEFSFIRSTREISQARQERWQKINKSAVEQSGRGSLLQIPPVQELRPFVQGLNRKSSVACLFAYEGGSPLDVRAELVRLKAAQPQEIWAVVGSEGGFSESEREFMRTVGHAPVTLGEQILRVETACFTLVSVIKYEFELLRGGT